MRLSMQVGYAGSHKESAALVAELEQVGLDVAWIAEAYSFDAPSYMGYLAAKTNRVEIAAGIVPLYTRTPSLLAMTAAGIDALSDGRCILGLGASGPQVIEGFHGVRFDKPLARTREIVDICRTVWRREEKLTHPGPLYPLPLPEGQGSGLGTPLKLINHPVRSAIPIYIAALGEKNLELTAEIADGWLPLFYLPEKAPEIFRPALAAGAAKRDPSLGPLEICAGGNVAIGELKDVAHLRDVARPLIALYVGGMGARGRNFYNTLVQRYGFEAEAKLIQDLYLDGKKKEAEAAVPQQLLELTSLIGPEGYVKERLAAYKESGVTLLNIAPLGRDQVDIVAKIRDWAA
jgi:F420-dependent oxidoreductase-like protein